MFNGQLQVLLMGNAPRARLGLTAATSNLVRQLGAAVGAAAGAALWARAADQAVRQVTGFALALVAVAGLALVRTGVPASRRAWVLSGEWRSGYAAAPRRRSRPGRPSAPACSR
jgi:hypothetical protein